MLGNKEGQIGANYVPTNTDLPRRVRVTYATSPVRRLPSFSDARLLGLDAAPVEDRTTEGPPACHGDADEADQEAEEQQAAPDVVQTVVDEEDLTATQEKADDDCAEEPALGEVDLLVARVSVLLLLDVLIGHGAGQNAEAQEGEHRGERQGGGGDVPQTEEQ